MEMHDRIKALRNYLGLTQTEFGSKIGFRQNTVGQMENGQRGITDRTILLICQTFNANEEWLRTGKGEMFNEDDNAEAVRLAQKFSLGKLGEAIIKGYTKLNDFEKVAVGKYIKSVAAEYEKAEKAKEEKPQEKNDTDKLDPDIKKELDNYRQELEIEKSIRTSSVSQDGKKTG